MKTILARAKLIRKLKDIERIWVDNDNVLYLYFPENFTGTYVRTWPSGRPEGPCRHYGFEYEALRALGYWGLYFKFVLWAFFTSSIYIVANAFKTFYIKMWGDNS